MVWLSGALPRTCETHYATLNDYMKKWLRLLWFVPILHAANEKPWTWKDSGQHLRTRADQDAILEAHKKWSGAMGAIEEGEKANLKAEKANLSRADLSGADLHRANLSNAILSFADLSGAILVEANLSAARLDDANLREADLSLADLSKAIIISVDLSGAIFEPSINPAPDMIASADHLDQLKWTYNSGPVFGLRKSFLEAGFRDAGRQVTAAIHRHDQSWLESWLFDRTCEWGANWLRPLGLVGILSLICTAIYWTGMHFERRSGLYLAATGQRITTIRGKQRVLRIRIRLPRTVTPSEQFDLDFSPETRPKARPQLFRRTLRREFIALGTAFLFSLMSVFNIGFREFDFGLWIRMMQPREFDIRARGWMRTVSGIQSLLGVALVGLSLLSYFGHPFD